MRTELPTIILILVSSLFFISALALPFVNTSGLLTGLDGSINVMDHSDLWAQLDVISAFFYGLGDMICHQEQSRTFMLNGNEMYICIRDFSLLTGFIIGMILSMVREELTCIDRKRAIIYLVLVLITPLEWLMEKFIDADLSVLRCITALITGAAIGIVLVCLIRKATSVQYE